VGLLLCVLKRGSREVFGSADLLERGAISLDALLFALYSKIDTGLA
jgi:hypothetical protein